MANTFPFSDPLGVARDTTQGIGLEAIDHRRAVGAFLQPSPLALGVKSGIVPDKENSSFGVLAISGLTVTMAGGWLVVDRGSGPYAGMAHRSWDVTLPDGDAANERIDRLVLRVRDPGVDGSVPESAFPVVIPGVPAASPVAPAAAAGDISLRTFRVGSGSSLFRTIRSHEDARSWTVTRGGVVLRLPGDDSPPAYRGQLSINLATDEIELGTIVAGALQWRARGTSAPAAVYRHTVSTPNNMAIDGAQIGWGDSIGQRTTAEQSSSAVAHVSLTEFALSPGLFAVTLFAVHSAISDRVGARLTFKPASSDPRYTFGDYSRRGGGVQDTFQVTGSVRAPAGGGSLICTGRYGATTWQILDRTLNIARIGD